MDVTVVVVNVGGVVIVAYCCWTVRWVWWMLRMLMCHASMFQTESVTDPSPAQTGMGTSQRNFFAPVPVPVAPVPIYPCRNLFPCPSLAGDELGMPLASDLHILCSYNFHELQHHTDTHTDESDSHPQ